MSASPQKRFKGVSQNQTASANLDRLQSPLGHEFVKRRAGEPVDVNGVVDAIGPDVEI
jgi:hypothetical protein